MTSNDNTAVLTVNDVMARWKCTRKTVLEAIHDGRLEAFRIGTRVFRVRLDEVVRYERAKAA